MAQYGDHIKETLWQWCNQCNATVELPPGELTADGTQENRTCENGHTTTTDAYYFAPPSQVTRTDTHRNT